MSDLLIWEHQLFDGLTELQRSWLSERVVLKELPVKSILYRPNDPADQVYLLLQGTIITETVDGQKNWLIREIASTNELFGLHGLFGQSTRQECARSLRSKTTVASINTSDLQRLMEVDFDFVEKIMHITATKTMAFEQRCADWSLLSACERFLCFLIKKLEKEGKRKGEHWFYDSEITQEEIGAYIGTGRQTVTEILAELKAKNILEYNWGKFRIKDLEQLRTLNEKC